MLNPITQALRAEMAPKGRKLNILCMPTHEGYQSMLAETGHNFYMLKVKGGKPWDYHTRPLPKNHFIVPYDNGYRYDIPIDLVMSQERFGQYPALAQIAKQARIPMIHLEHTEPRPEWTPKQKARYTSLPLARRTVYITEFNKNSWDDPNGTIIYHGIDTNLFKSLGTKRGKHGVSVVNLFPQRDVFCGWTLWQQIAKEVHMALFGYNPGICESINDPKVLNEKLNEAAFFLNTSQLSPVPLSLLEAAAAGCPIVTTANQEVPKIFKHNDTCLMSNNPKELIEYCKTVLNESEAARDMGLRARQMIESKFSMSRFVENWNQLFKEVVNA